MVIIGFGHRARVGKDTVVRTIIDNFSSKYDIRRYAFADALKEEVAGKEEELCKRYDIPPITDKYGKYRDLLQFWGEKKRTENEHYWIQRLFSKIDVENPKIALISDVRYKNEAAYIKDREGYLILVERYKDGTLYKAPDTNHDHKSETDLQYFTDWWAEIRCNDGDIDDLKRSAVELFKMIEDDLDVVGNFLRALESEEPISFKIRGI